MKYLILFAVAYCMNLYSNNYCDYIENKTFGDSFMENLNERYLGGEKFCLVLGRGINDAYTSTQFNKCTWIYLDISKYEPNEHLGIRMDFNEDLDKLPRVFQIVAIDWSTIKFVYNETLLDCFNLVAEGGIYISESDGWTLQLVIDDVAPVTHKKFPYQLVETSLTKQLGIFQQLESQHDNEYWEKECEEKCLIYREGDEIWYYFPDQPRLIFEKSSYSFQVAEKLYWKTYVEPVVAASQVRALEFARKYFKVAERKFDVYPLPQNYLTQDEKVHFFYFENRNEKICEK